MVGSSILPVTFYKNELYFLFGKEAPLEMSAKGWSDFGGGVEAGESITETAMREGGEELTGFLGDATALKKHVRNHGGLYKINYNDQYHIHVMYIPYDENLPKYYNQNHRFLWDRMNQKMLKKTKLFEKIEIGWFSPKQAKQHRHQFRFFYREILDTILQKIPDIRSHFGKYSKSLLYFPAKSQIASETLLTSKMSVGHRRSLDNSRKNAIQSQTKTRNKRSKKNKTRRGSLFPK